MSIPDYQTLLLPLLKLIAQKGTLNRRDAVQLISDDLKLNESERHELLPSGRVTVIRSRVGWARTYLRKAGLIDYPRRGVAEITERGKQVLSESPEKIDVQYLQQFPEFLDFRDTNLPEKESIPIISFEQGTPEEVLEGAYSQLKNEVLGELLNKTKSSTPEFFEELVVNVMVQMGYGGSLQDAGRAIGRSGDEGIDGIIKEDRLGLDVIYLQAKKWEGNVGRPEIQKFAGALQGKRAKKGILITTSDFTPEAKEYVKNIDATIILLSGRQLVELMWEHDIGLSNVSTYMVKKLDVDYFSE